MSWTKAQHVEAGTWWDQPGDPPQEVLDARKKHGFNPDLSPYTGEETPAEKKVPAEKDEKDTPAVVRSGRRGNRE
jgi:hypothetical protein